MRTLHIVPGDSAGGSLKRALLDAGCDDEVLRFLDDLSCGPIASGEPAERSQWWARFHDDRDIEPHWREFWDRVSAADEQLVVWVGRHRASELAFLLAFVARLGDRPYKLIDVTDLRFPFTYKDGSLGLSPPKQSVGLISPDHLRSRIGTEKSVTPELRKSWSLLWRQLKTQSAPFRVVTEAGMESAPEDYFDPLILKQATTEWQPAARIIGETIGYNMEPYEQVDDVMLHARVVALVDQGKLLADGDPRHRRACRIRLPA